MTNNNPGSQNPPNKAALPGLFRVMICVLVIVGAALLTSTAYTRDGITGWVHFICDDGDRFAVDFQRSHVRLRHGTGVFALSAQNEHDEDAIYSGGELTFIDTGDSVTLERRALERRQKCVVADAN